MKQYLTRKNLGWLLTGLIGFALLASAAAKLSGAEEMMTQFAASNIENWVTIIAIGEIISVILFIVPKTMRLGLVLLSAYFGGAIMSHMASNNTAFSDFTAPAVFLVFIWVVAWVRGFDFFAGK
jgi:hypothetical protein